MAPPKPRGRIRDTAVAICVAPYAVCSGEQMGMYLRLCRNAKKVVVEDKQEARGKSDL